MNLDAILAVITHGREGTVMPKWSSANNPIGRALSKEDNDVRVTEQRGGFPLNRRVVKHPNQASSASPKGVLVTRLALNRKIRLMSERIATRPTVRLQWGGTQREHPN
jgi:hypothetical protein